MTSKLLILDGPSLAYRCILGQGPVLTSGDGEPTRGTYTFCRSFLKLMRHVAPDYAAVCWDTPRRQLHRREWFPGYKAKRDDRDEERGAEVQAIMVQIARIRQIVEALGLPLLEVPRWEADDVIASLVDICAGPTCDAVVVSSDKDLMQLVTARPLVTMLHPTELSVTGAAGVFAKWGVAPDRMIDLQALMGDTTDGVPGVKGIGHKRAVALLTAWGDLESVADAAELTQAERKGAVGGMTEKQAETIRETDLDLMRRLVTLDRGLDLDVTEEELAYDGLDMRAASPIFRALGFRRWED